MDISDELILELMAQAGSVDRGFRLLIQTYQERLYWHVRRLVTDHEDANDVLQNAFVKAYRGIGSFRGQSKLFTWLFRIATNEAITFLQQRSRRQVSSLDEAQNSLADQLRADPFFDGEDIQAHLLVALGQLPDKQRLVFNLRYFDEMPYQEMAQLLDTSVGALKASYHHAAKKIEHYFREMQIGYYGK